MKPSLGCKTCGTPFMVERLVAVARRRRAHSVTFRAIRISRDCIDRAKRYRSAHSFDKDNRCIFCNWLLPDGFSICEECGQVREDANAFFRKARRAAYHAGPEMKARKAVFHAVKAGKLARPDRCSACGTEGPVEGHHPDYSKPLSVRWLCAKCHGATHSLEATA